MARLSWGNPGERTFSAGVDKGVFVVGPIQGEIIPAYAWPGLISVNESSDGGAATPFYIDGYKYLNLSGKEEFKATINAFSAPKEFDPCDGAKNLYRGLIATQQPRQPFDFSYRTLIGNDLEGVDHGYQIHIVYGALAAPSSRNNTSVGKNLTPGTLSWNITTKPSRVAGIRPTSHFIVDSRTAEPVVLKILEEQLYGDDRLDAFIPNVESLIQLFSLYG